VATVTDLIQIKVAWLLLVTIMALVKRRSPMLEHDRALREHAIQERAFYIWEHKGRPVGEDLHNWLTAECELGYERPRSWADALKDDGGSNTLAR
jgi:hypothetical protein